MNQLVIIKGNKYGITICLDEKAPFEQLKEALREKLGESGDFFQDVKLALSFEGRQLTTEEQRQLLKIIESYSQLNIVCLMDNEKETEERFRQAVEWAGKQEEILRQPPLPRRMPADRQSLLDDCYLGNKGQFYKGTLRSGQIVESEYSVVVLGDIQAGARLIARGNIVVLGTLKGYAYAGAGGSSDAFIAALRMEAVQMRIGNISFQSSEESVQAYSKEPQIAAVERGHIHIQPLMMY